MTELEKARDEFVANYDSVTDKDGRLCLWSILFALKEGFEKGAEWQAKPEHMKLTEEVKGLIKALKDLSTVMSYITDEANGKKECHIMACVALVDLLDSKALKPFEKEGF